MKSEPRIELKVFSAPKASESEFLGKTTTDWIRTHPDCEVFDKVVTQLSDREFHCIPISAFSSTRPVT